MSKVGAPSFKATLLSSASGLSNGRATATASPSPAPSQAPASSSQTSKNRPPVTTTLKTEGIHSQPADTGAGQRLVTQITYAVGHLKDKKIPKSLDDIISYLSLPYLTTEQIRTVGRVLGDHPSVSFDEAGFDGKGAYTFKSRYNIHNSSELLRYLQGLPTFQGLPAHDLIEGWADSEDGIRDLEAEDKLLVLRSRKDDKAKMVWLDDPTLRHPIDTDFRDMWTRIKLPDAEATAADLERNGLLPTNKFKKPKLAPTTHSKKQKKHRKSGKVTNSHMTSVLKDYSKLRK